MYQIILMSMCQMDERLAGLNRFFTVTDDGDVLTRDGQPGEQGEPKDFRPEKRDLRFFVCFKEMFAL